LILCTKISDEIFGILKIRCQKKRSVIPPSFSLGGTLLRIFMILSLFFENIRIIPSEEYFQEFTKAQKLIRDQKDVPYVACCIFSKSDGIWTHDSGFLEQNTIKIFTNVDLIKML